MLAKWSLCINSYYCHYFKRRLDLPLIDIEALREPLKVWHRDNVVVVLILSIKRNRLADPREWPRSHTTFNWPIKSSSFPRFVVHRTWTRSRFSFKTAKYIDVTLIWMIKYVQYLIMAWIITSHLESFTDITNYFATHEKVEADEPHGNWRITVVQSECKSELTYHVVDCIFSWQEKTVSW